MGRPGDAAPLVPTAEDPARYLLDLEEIKALKYRYWRACDGKDVAGFRGCFTPDAHIELGSVGVFDDADEAAAAFERLGCQKKDGEYVVLDMHHGIHPVIALDGNGSATGRWTLRFRQVNLVSRHELVSTGDYHDEYAKEDGRWLIRSSVFEPAWAIRRPLGEETRVGAVGAWGDP